MLEALRHAAPAPLRIRAPAKVNLGLRVLGRRPDGYHLIESLFVPIDLCDELRVEASPGADSGGSPASPRESEIHLRVVAEGQPPGSVPADERNLAVRAARLFLERAKRPGLGLDVVLYKRIPAGGGLGGGSSDAGAMLRALDRLLPGAVSREELEALALGLGADVPFFLDPQPALVTGIGERIEPLSSLPGLWLLLVHPGVSLATAHVYAAYDERAGALTQREPGSTMRALSRLSDDSRALAELLENDLEAAAEALCPAIGQLRGRIGRLGALAAGMSGSGATVYGVFPDEASARRAHAQAGFEASIWAQVAATMGSQ